MSKRGSANKRTQMSEQTPEMKAMFGGKTRGGFFDLPLARPGDTQDADIVIIGAPAATPYPSVGNYCATAPDAIRNAFGWPEVLGHHDFDIDGFLLPEGVRALDWGNLDYSETDFAANRASIQNHVTSILDAGALPLVLGGDDSTPIPVLDAYRDHGPLTILQLDAHIDWRDEVGGETRWSLRAWSPWSWDSPHANASSPYGWPRSPYLPCVWRHSAVNGPMDRPRISDQLI